MDCGHGWRSAADCDVCTLHRVNPQAADRIAELEAALREIAADGEGEPPYRFEMVAIARAALED
jgi:hypothetical protein